MSKDQEDRNIHEDGEKVNERASGDAIIGSADLSIGQRREGSASRILSFFLKF